MGKKKRELSAKAKLRPFNLVSVGSNDYERVAEEIATTYMETGVMDQDKLNFVREESMNDRRVLKGDYVVSVFIDRIMKEKGCFKGYEVCPFVKTKNKEYKLNKTKEKYLKRLYEESNNDIYEVMRISGSNYNTVKKYLGL